MTNPNTELVERVSQAIWDAGYDKKETSLDDLAQAAIAAVYEWRDISSAPRDERIQLLFDLPAPTPDVGNVVIGRYSTVGARWIAQHINPSAYRHSPPIGWLPLPPAPEGTE